MAPGGGKKDVDPPKVVKYIPDSASLNFKSKSIEVFFDEFVQLKDLNNQLIISPPLESAPDIKVKNKSLIIDFDKKEILKPNTTYSISFGNALQDIHEGNFSENLKYIFSTGSFIDSLMLKGKIENAFDHKSEKGILVMLYSDFSDSVIYKKKPEYFAKTKEDGSFQIDNIRNDNFRLLALKDANANYIYDNESESIGFIDSLIDVSKKRKFTITVFQEPAKKVFLKKTIYSSYGKIIFVFNKSTDSISIIPLNNSFSNDDVLLEYSKKKDSLNYIFRNCEKDSLILQVKNGNRIMDTVSFKLINKEDALKNKRNPFALKVISSPAGNQNFDLNAEFKIVFNNPIAKWNNQAIQMKEDSLVWKKTKDLSYGINLQTISLLGLDTTSVQDPNNPSKKFIASVQSEVDQWKENTSYHLFIPPGTFTDFFGLTNDSIKIDFKTREKTFYCTLKLKIEIPETKGNYIVQLLDEKEIPIREHNIKKSETINYEYLYSKKYKLKIIYDDNANYNWDTGNLLLKQQPEKVIYNSEPVNLRPNWDMELDWKVSP